MQSPLRVLIANWSTRLAGGAESYIASIVPGLTQYGCELAMLAERDEPLDRDPIPLVDDCPVWDISTAGLEVAMAQARRWSPDVVFLHGMHDPAIEAAALGTAPAVFLAHNYYGTCISGTKAFKSPTVVPCDRMFGAPCLALYLPLRCGGLSPKTMWRMYRRESTRLRHLALCSTVLTLSEHMRREMEKHLPTKIRVTKLPFPTPLGYGLDSVRDRDSRRVADPRRPVRLLLVGRMDLLKGGGVAIDTLRWLKKLLEQPISLVLVGDGPDRQRLEQRANATLARYADLKVTFAGWCDRETVRSHMDHADVLVVPSMWPEPFGLVGLEAAHRSLPAAAFAVGGIPEWLRDEENGYLAPADPPNAHGLARAIAACVASDDQYDMLCRGAGNIARQLNQNAHVEALVTTLRQAAAGVS